MNCSFEDGFENDGGQTARCSRIIARLLELVKDPRQGGGDVIR